MSQKKINVSIDKISIVGEFDWNHDINFLAYYGDLILHNKFYMQHPLKQVNAQTRDFEYSYMLEGLAFIQYGTTGKVRLEFNPNKMGYHGREFIEDALRYCTNIHFTRLDVALDLFNYEVGEYNIIDIASRKKAYYYDRQNRVETVYLGSLKSGRFIRIYNKAVEQHEKNMDWWRFELQLRDNYIEKYLLGLDSLFEGIYIFKYLNLDKYDIQTKSMINYILGDITRYNELSKNSRTRYKDIIKSLKLETFTYLYDIINESRDVINSYLGYLSKKETYAH